MRRFLSCLFAVFLSLPFAVSAQQASSRNAPPLALPDNADIRIIVDISGSMKANDPDNLRQPAVRLLARMLPEGASAGVWTFGQYVNMLVPHAEVTDNWRQQAVDRSQQINSVALRTNLGEALRVASEPYLAGSEDLDSTDFILLTDGKVDISDDANANEAEREDILGPMLEELSSRGATIHTVALSDEADLALLETLTAETGGSYSLAPSAAALTRAFLKALNTAVPQQQIAIEGDGFTVDSGVEEFTALIFRADEEPAATRELGLISPDGQEATAGSATDGMRWVRETEYDLITVTDPAVGKWQIDGELGEGSRVTVVSDLRMVVSPVPPTFTADEPVAVRVAFFEGDQKIDNPDFLGVIDVRLTLTSDDGRSGTKALSGDEPPQDGVYSDDIGRLPDAGEYQLDIVADGQTFSRRLSAVTRFVVPGGGETAVAAESGQPRPEPEPAPEPEPKPKPEPEPEPALSEQAGADTGPIDISQVEEQPDSDPVTDNDESGGLPLWVMAAAGGTGALGIAGAVFLAVRRRKPGAEEEPPVIAPEEQEADEPEPEEEIPVAEPEPEPEEEIAEDDIPVAEVTVEEPEPETEDAIAEEDDEFGLEDFDLSEFDDLPDADDEKGLLDDDSGPEDREK
ncbi:VWA domain-containing protein [Marinobacter orientalis]|uniref:VWA domain-containing protein n=1 Tax=Marinobacter orientalis TaxID=1928859 RepID=A0A7Y0RCL3_9GAMM|nr:vWA domain-containing protein [Marinobacter orientalis]NMT63763.1 VWA domain-containing protein [Marinobacter orientalis]TGX49873.1 VWA domain-containing protein [Marinobacter orientalis]